VDLWGEVRGGEFEETPWRLLILEIVNHQNDVQTTNPVNDPSTGHTQIDMSWKMLLSTVA